MFIMFFLFFVHTLIYMRLKEDGKMGKKSCYNKEEFCTIFIFNMCGTKVLAAPDCLLFSNRLCCSCVINFIFHIKYIFYIQAALSAVFNVMIRFLYQEWKKKYRVCIYDRHHHILHM